MEISFNFQKQCTLTNRNRLRNFILKLFNQEQTIVQSLSFVFCTDDFLLQINRAYLQHDYLTDIITFDLSVSKKTPIIGEVYISIDRIRENSIRYNTTISKELHRVIFHGALHLCGYKDKTKKEKVLMTQKEDIYLKEYLKILSVPRETHL